MASIHNYRVTVVRGLKESGSFDVLKTYTIDGAGEDDTLIRSLIADELVFVSSLCKSNGVESGFVTVDTSHDLPGDSVELFGFFDIFNYRCAFDAGSIFAVLDADEQYECDMVRGCVRDRIAAYRAVWAESASEPADPVPVVEFVPEKTREQDHAEDCGVFHVETRPAGCNGAWSMSDGAKADLVAFVKSLGLVADVSKGWNAWISCPDKDTGKKLKAAGFCWSRKRGAWYCKLRTA